MRSPSAATCDSASGISPAMRRPMVVRYGTRGKPSALNKLASRVSSRHNSESRKVRVVTATTVVKRKDKAEKSRCLPRLRGAGGGS